LPRARPGDPGEELAVVVTREVRPQEPEHGQGDGTGRDERADGGESAREAGGLDAAARFVLAELQLLHAVREEGREALAHVEAARVHLSQVQDELGRDTPMSADDDVKFAEQRIVRDSGEVRE
jgi:hypothetical protein